MTLLRAIYYLFDVMSCDATGFHMTTRFIRSKLYNVGEQHENLPLIIELWLMRAETEDVIRETRRQQSKLLTLFARSRGTARWLSKSTLLPTNTTSMPSRLAYYKLANIYALIIYLTSDRILNQDESNSNVL